MTTIRCYFYHGVSRSQNKAGRDRPILNNKDSKSTKYFVLYITKEV